MKKAGRILLLLGGLIVLASISTLSLEIARQNVLKNDEEIKFTGNYKVYGEDLSGDGIYDRLVVEVEIAIQRFVYYSLVGSVFSQKGEMITNRKNATAKTPSSVKVFRAIVPSVAEEPTVRERIYFSGEDILKSGIDGPYNIKLYLKRGKHVFDEITIKTPAFKHKEFGEAPTRIEYVHDWGEDIDRDGLYDYLTVYVGVTTLNPGKYTLSATILNKKGLSTKVSNIDCSKLIELQFYDPMLRLAKLNGPYDVLISLTNEDGTSSAHVKYTTSRYKYEDFQMPINKFTKKCSHYGIDLDADGWYDYLSINVELDIKESGWYTVKGRLSDKDGQTIAITTTSKKLKKGKQSVTLHFDGHVIYQSQKEGPYYLDLTLLKSKPVERIEDQRKKSTAYLIIHFRIFPNLMSKPLLHLTCLNGLD